MSESIMVVHSTGWHETPTAQHAIYASKGEWMPNTYYGIIRLLMLAGFCLLCSTARAQFTVEVIPQVQRFDVVIQQPVVVVDREYYVCFFKGPRCPPCNNYVASGKLAALKLRFPVTIIDISEQPEWEMRVPTFWLARRSDRKVVARYTGSTDVSIFVAEIDRLTKPQIKQKVQSTQDLIRLHDEIHNQASGLDTHWTYPGDIRTHLQSVHHVSL